MYREDRNIDFVEIESFVEPLGPAVKEKPDGKAPAKAAVRQKDEKKPIRAKEFLDGSILIREAMTRQLPFVLVSYGAGRAVYRKPLSCRTDGQKNHRNGN